MENSKAKVKALLSPFFPDIELAEDQDIFALDEVSSLFAMQLVLLVEKEFQITLQKQDLNFDHFRSITGIARLVDRKLSEAQ